MLKRKISEALAYYAGASLSTAYYNLSISLQFKNIGYEGFSRYFRSLYNNHTRQAVDIYDYVSLQGSIPNIYDIKDIQSGFTSIPEAFERSLIQTIRLSDALESLMQIFIDEQDHTSYAQLQHLLQKQFAEEVELSQMIEQLKMCKSSDGYVYLNHICMNKVI